MNSIIITGIDMALFEQQRLALPAITAWVAQTSTHGQNAPAVSVLVGIQNMMDAISDRHLMEEELRKAGYDSQAREIYCENSDNDIEIDDEPHFSESEDGVWVSAWLWVNYDYDRYEE